MHACGAQAASAAAGAAPEGTPVPKNVVSEDVAAVLHRLGLPPEIKDQLLTIGVEFVCQLPILNDDMLRDAGVADGMRREMLQRFASLRASTVDDGGAGRS